MIHRIFVDRDFNARNVLLDRSPAQLSLLLELHYVWCHSTMNARLGDFGLARTELTGESADFGGSFVYLDPE